MMTSHGKLRKEKGSLAEYESQMKGKRQVLASAHISLFFLHVHEPACMSARARQCKSMCAVTHPCACLHACA